MLITKDKSGHVLKFAGKLTIRAVAQTHETLREYFGGEVNPVFDLSEVEACDTAGLQLLCSASKTAESLGKHIEFAGVSDAVRNASAILGFPPWSELEDRSGSLEGGV